MTPDLQPSEAVTISAAANPDLARSLVAQAVKPDAEASPPPMVADYPDTVVTLPGGRLLVDGTVVKTAEVRELTGADEEAIAKANTLAKQIDVILDRGVVAVGEETATADVLGSMLAGDLDHLLLSIRIATLGNEMSYGTVRCQSCSNESEQVVDLLTDVPSRTLNEDDRYFSVAARGVSLEMNLPDRDCMKALANTTERSLPALNTVLLSKCISRINGLPVLSPTQIRDLPIRVRDAALAAIGDRVPGPRLSEVSRSCNECSESIPLPLTLADLFRL